MGRGPSYSLDEDLLIAVLASTHTGSQIARRLGRPVAGVRARAHDLGIDLVAWKEDSALRKLTSLTHAARTPDDRTALGICTYGHCQNPAAATSIQCSDHAAKSNQRSRQWSRKRSSQRRSARVCSICTLPLDVDESTGTCVLCRTERNASQRRDRSQRAIDGTCCACSAKVTTGRYCGECAPKKAAAVARSKQKRRLRR